MMTLRSVLHKAEQQKIAVGHFNFSDLVVLKAIREAAWGLIVPVLVGLSEGERDFVRVRQATALMRRTARQGLKDMRTITASHVKGFIFLVLALLAAVIFGCGTIRSEAKVVPITTFKQVAGKWEGLSRRMPDMRRHAQVVVIINENGRFNFISDRGSGLLLGTGTLTILNGGQVSGTAGSGRGTFTLHDKAGASVLVLEAALNDGNHYYLEMTQMK